MSVTQNFVAVFTPLWRVPELPRGTPGLLGRGLCVGMTAGDGSGGTVDVYHNLPNIYDIYGSSALVQLLGTNCYMAPAPVASVPVFYQWHTGEVSNIGGQMYVYPWLSTIAATVAGHAPALLPQGKFRVQPVTVVGTYSATVTISFTTNVNGTLYYTCSHYEVFDERMV